MPELARQGRSVRGRAPGDQWAGDKAPGNALAAVRAHPMDAEPARALHRQLLEWYYTERERQAANRMEMATDADFYDNLQWSPEDIAALEERGQMPLVYNEIAPMVDWLIGTERRARVDWRVLPRTEDDVKAAETKTKVLKYVSDVNRAAFARSQAFAEAVKVGVGWLDDGIRDDPSQEPIYSRRDSWRNVLWDSTDRELDLPTARYLFRWRWVDVDIAIAMFPDRREAILRSANDTPDWHSDGGEDEDLVGATAPVETEVQGRVYASGTGATLQARRARVKLIEGQYRMPTTVKVVRAGAFRGAVLDPRDSVLMGAVERGEITSISDRVMMRVHGAVFTEGAMLGMAPTIYRHNKFSLTPVWCYRRDRDGMPYGVIRRVRSIQQDLNKRASKALFTLNTNQLIAEEGAFDDLDVARDEADRPDGVLIHKAGKLVQIRRDTDAATGQLKMMELDAMSIQKSSGVNDDNLGRRTNASSGVAIEARQLQGAVQTTEPLDNLRFATQCQGEKQLSLTEQFYTEEKVIRLTGTKGALEWVRINTPELQPDGSVRFLNDITASQADFQVSEQDYAGTMRQVMLENLSQIAMKLPPEVSLRILTIAMEFSDLPNKDEVADAIRRITGERDPEKEMTPEEAQQAEEQMRQQAEALQLQREQALAVLEGERAKVRQLNAQAAKLEAEAMAAGQAGVDPQVQGVIDQLRKDAADQIDALSAQLQKANSELANRTLQIKSDGDTKREVALIQADATARVATIQAASEAKLEPLVRRMDDLVRQLQETQSLASEAQARAEQAEKALQQQAQQAEVDKAAAKATKDAEAQAAQASKATEKAEPAPAAAAPAMAPITLTVNVDATPGEVTKTIELKNGPDGKPVAATVTETPKKKARTAAKPTKEA